MKKQKVQAKINLEALAGGAFAEKLNEALMQLSLIHIYEPTRP